MGGEDETRENDYKASRQRLLEGRVCANCGCSRADAC